ncbi:MAG: hypothetical protein HZA36_00400 [Parcubacteria group bacterium]|nr:hypothetical protein [Parcubacteria group bacterium]
MLLVEEDDPLTIPKNKWIYVAGDGGKWSKDKNPPGADHCHFSSASCAAEARALSYYYPCEGHFVGKVFYQGGGYDTKGKMHKMWRVVCCPTLVTRTMRRITGNKYYDKPSDLFR